MSCEECARSLETDGEIPDCETDKGCTIPPLTVRGRRIMDIRDKLVKLKDLIDPGPILTLYGVTVEDLDLLSKVQDLIGSLKKNDG